jgi:thiamine biosynthesis lipoprotein
VEIFDQSVGFLLMLSRKAMACDWEVLLPKNSPDFAVEEAEAALALLERLENCWSIYRPHSELARLNASREVYEHIISEDVRELLSASLQAYQLTQGGFDITSGSLSETWGFSRQKARKPDSHEIAAALTTVGSHHLQLDFQNSKLTISRPGLKLNPGGIGKGLALERLAAWLISSGVENFLVHGGKSSIRGFGNRRSGERVGWPIAVRNPADPNQILGKIHLQNQAIGTSGHAHQFFHYQGVRFGHVIDPRSGYPVQGVESVTVIAPDATLADALATGLYVLGPSQWERFAQLNPQIGIVGLLPGRRTGTVEVQLWNIGDGVWETV